MPFTHRNLLVMMIVGCVVGMFGAGKTACAIADNELTIQLDVSATNVSRDDFFFWFSTDITSAVNADSSHAPLPVPLMEQTFWWKDYPQGIIVKGLTSQRMIIGRDPSGLGFENNTAVDGNNPTNSPGYLT